MPWFSHYEYAVNDQAWTRVKGAMLPFVVQPGRNDLRVRAVNARGVPGPVTSMLLSYE